MLTLFIKHSCSFLLQTRSNLMQRGGSHAKRTANSRGPGAARLVGEGARAKGGRPLDHGPAHGTLERRGSRHRPHLEQGSAGYRGRRGRVPQREPRGPRRAAEVTRDIRRRMHRAQIANRSTSVHTEGHTRARAAVHLEAVDPTFPRWAAHPPSFDGMVARLTTLENTEAAFSPPKPPTL